MRFTEIRSNTTFSVIAAIVLYYVLGTAGVFLIIRYGNWWILSSPDGKNGLVTLQVVSLYLSLFASKIPAAFVAGLIISLSRVRRPYWMAIFIVLFVELLTFSFRLIRWPLYEMDFLYVQLPALTAEIVGIFLLVGISTIIVASMRTLKETDNKAR